jgi:hypothetical protein
MDASNTSPDNVCDSFIKQLSLLMACLLSLLLSASILASGQGQGRRPYRYLIPEGYVGWVRVDFNVKDAPELPIEDGYYILMIPPSGRLLTSSDDMLGLKGDEYYYVCGNTKHLLSIDSGNDRSMIWHVFSGPTGTAYATDRPLKFRYVFVGPKEEHYKYRFDPNNLSNLDKEADGFPQVGSKYNLVKRTTICHSQSYGQVPQSIQFRQPPALASRICTVKFQ